MGWKLSNLCFPTLSHLFQKADLVCLPVFKVRDVYTELQSDMHILFLTPEIPSEDGYFLLPIDREHEQEAICILLVNFL